LVVQTSATNKRLRLLLTGIRDKTLIPNPHFQRRLVWSNAHKVSFLETVLEGLPFPEIFISAGEVNPDTGDGTELIVDGQQRVTTLFQYFNGSKDLRLSGTSVPPYAELEGPRKLQFLEYEVVVRDLGPLTEDETRDIFQRINSTKYSLNAMEVNNSRFDGELKRFAEGFASNQFFEAHNVFTNLDGRRMNDVRFVLTVVISLMSDYFNRDDEHETYLEHYNDEFPMRAEIHERLEAALSVIELADFHRKSRIWQKADLLTAIVETDRILHKDGRTIEPAELRLRIEAFYGEVEKVTRTASPATDAAEYYRRVRSGINDRTSRYARGEAWRGRAVGAPALDL
jgi:hypothetical protein